MGGVANPLGVRLLVFGAALDVVGKHYCTVTEVGLKKLDDLCIHCCAAVEQYDVNGATRIHPDPQASYGRRPRESPHTRQALPPRCCDGPLPPCPPAARSRPGCRRHYRGGPRPDRYSRYQRMIQTRQSAPLACPEPSDTGTALARDSPARRSHAAARPMSALSKGRHLLAKFRHLRLRAAMQAVQDLDNVGICERIHRDACAIRPQPETISLVCDGGCSTGFLPRPARRLSP